MDINNIEIIVGTYEEFVLGYKLISSPDKTFEFLTSFAVHSHTASVRSISHGGRFLASSSTDETIALYDMRTRKENAPLIRSSTVSCVKFTSDGTHMLSGSNDGKIVICRTGSWQTEKEYTNVHKGSIVDIAIHPSDKLFFSLGTDGIMHVWNLIKGRKAYSTNFGKKGASLVGLTFSDDGQYYAIAGGLEVTIYLLEHAALLKTVQVESRIASICFYEHILLIGCDNGKIMVISLEKDEIKNIQAHSSRVKCLKVFVSKNKVSYLVSCSSDGDIKLWKIKSCKNNYVKVKEICSINCGSRITSLDVMECLTNNESVKEESTNDPDKTTTNETQSSNKTAHKSKKRKKIHQSE